MQTKKPNYLLRLKVTRICGLVVFALIAISAAITGKSDTLLICLPFVIALLPVYCRIQSWAQRQKNSFAIQFLVFSAIVAASIFIRVLLKSGLHDAVVAILLFSGYCLFIAFIGNRLLGRKEHST